MAFSLVQIWIITITFLFLTYKIYKSLKNVRLPPGPRPWPLIGNTYVIKPLWHRCFAEWSRKYGPVISVWFGSELNIIVSNSELAKEVLKDNDQHLANRHRTRPAVMITNNGKDLIWADYGSEYVKMRKICTVALFSAKSIESFRHVRENEVTLMSETIFKDSKELENKSLVLRPYLASAGLNVITRMVFGKRFVTKDGVSNVQGLEFKAVMNYETNLSASLGIFDLIWWLNWIPKWNGNEEFRIYSRRKTHFIRGIMEEHRNEEKLKNKPFVKSLLEMQEIYDLTEDTMIKLLWDMISAGSDTVPITVEWAMAELIKNPNVQQKAHEELDLVIGRHRHFSESDVPNLPYLQCIVKETLRLHPPTPLILPHKSDAEVKINGYKIPKGTTFFVNVWAVGTDPKVWHEPNQFKPDRFLVEEVDVKGQDFRVLPFGSGRRVCPGAQLGITTVTLMLGQLLHCFKWKLPLGFTADQILMEERPGLVTYMQTPVESVPEMRLQPKFYKNDDVMG